MGLFLYSHSSALDISQIHFDILDIKNGLSQNSITNIYQDSRGFMWFCTNDGLNRYDGYNFIKFDRQPENKNSLVSNFTTCLTESSPGIFWVGTEKGLSVFFYDKSKYLNLQNLTQIKKIIVEDSITTWVQTQYSLYKIRLQRDENKKQDEYNFNIEPMNSYHEIFETKDKDHFFLIGRNNQLFSYDIRTKLSKSISNTDALQKLIAKKITTITKDNYNNYWIGTNIGIYKTNADFTSVDSFTTQKIKTVGLQDKIMSIAKGKMGNIYIATYQRGLVIYDIQRNKFMEYQNDPYNLTSLPDNKTMSLLIDNSGTLWVGTKGAGVAMFSQFKFKFKHITQEPFKTTWLMNKYVLSFETDKNDNIWIGTDGGGLYKYNSKDNIFSNWRYSYSNTSLSNDIVSSLLIDSYNNLWVGTLNGICKFNSSTNVFKRYNLGTTKTSANLRIPAYNLVLLFETKGHELYAINEQAIYHFSTTKNLFEALPFTLGGTNISTHKIIENKDSTWWMATSNGLIHFSTQTGILKENELKIVNKKYFKADKLNYILPKNNQELWIGSGNNGLFQFNTKTLKTTANYTERNGLSNNNIYGILEDNSGKLWMSTNRGISVFYPELKYFRNYDINDGLQSNEFNNGACYKTTNNELLFGGIDGFNIINPDKIPFNKYKPIANITSIKTDENTFNSQSYTTLKNRTIFKNQQNNISFEFTSSDYVNTPKNMFEYKLKGYEKNWTRTSRNYTAYAQLPPGNYTFYVRVSNNDGVWSDVPASFSFRIRPMFWQTWWFKIITIIMIVSYAYYTINNRVKNARKKDKERMKLDRQKTEYEKQLAEIKLKALVAQMNPHFIFNCMNSIQAMILSDQNIEASMYLTKLSRLVRSVLENSVKTFIPLQEVIDSLKLYLELESLRFDKQFNYEIQVNNIDTHAIEMPSMLIQPYVENAIWHGLLKKDGEKNLYIKFYKIDAVIYCEVEDNGIGRTNAAYLNLKKQHKSLGTIITKEMFETLHKIKDTDFHVETIDLYDENHLASGTKVIIKMEIN